MARNTSAPSMEIVEVEGIAEFAAFDHVISALEAAKSTKKAPLQKLLSTFWFAEAAENDVFPRSFIAEDGNARAVCTLRQKPSNRPLSEADLRKIAAAGIIPTLGRKTVRVNPKYMDDERFIKALSKLVAESKDDAFPDDLFETVTPGVVIDEKLLLRVLRVQGQGETAFDLLSTVADVVISKMEISSDDPMGTALKTIEEHLPKTK